MVNVDCMPPPGGGIALEKYTHITVLQATCDRLNLYRPRFRVKSYHQVILRLVEVFEEAERRDLISTLAPELAARMGAVEQSTSRVRPNASSTSLPLLTDGQELE